MAPPVNPYVQAFDAAWERTAQLGALAAVCAPIRPQSKDCVGHGKDDADFS